MSKENLIDREHDGITHINIWSKAKTELGQLLSNFAHTPFTLEEYGAFASVEALWYWLATGMTHQEIRRMYGASAKTYGKKFPRVEMDQEKFQHIVCQALRCKIEHTPKLKAAFTKSVLPFEHYFVFGRNMETIVDQRKKHGWQTDFLEKLRDEYRKDAGMDPAAETLEKNPQPLHKLTKRAPKEGWIEDAGFGHGKL